jgi:hypothetical protein
MSDAEIPLEAGSRALHPWGWGTDLCAPFVELLPVTGGSISVFGLPGRELTICSSDPVAARMEELQFDLGEGPHWVVARTGLPVMSPDLAKGDHQDWPMFASAVADLGVAALFAFPLTMGEVIVGVVDLYRDEPGPLAPDDVAQASSLARMVVGPAVSVAIRSAGDQAVPEIQGAPAIRREVHQAIGMILIQRDTTATEAFSLLRARAFASDRSVQDVARDVVARRLDFTDLPG